MPRTSALLVGAAFVLLAWSTTVAAQQPADDHDPQRLVVGVRELPDVAAGAPAFGGTVVFTIPQVRALVVELPSQAAAERARAQAATDPNVRYVETDSLVHATAFEPNDQQWPGQWGPRRVGAPDAWTHGLGDSGILVAVVDSGILHTHMDLRGGRMLPGWNATDGSTEVKDNCDHGTAVAGIVAATTDNGEHMAGMAQVRVLPIKFLDRQSDGSCSGWTSAGARAIAHAADEGADIITNSWGGGSSRVIADAVQYAFESGAVVIASAGNNGPQEDSVSDNWAPLEDMLVIVSAATEKDELASWSSRGPQVTLTAPGINITSLSSKGDTWMRTFAGTSASAPFVAGVAALMRSADPSLPRSEVARLLNETAQDLGPQGRDDHFGHGMVRADLAVAAVIDPPGFRFDVTKASGNEWWIEARVDANEPLAGVEARVDGGDWRALELRDWGAWAASMSAPEGSLVQFRAIAADGDVAHLPHGHRWTSAAQHPAPGAFAADFRNIKGSDAWVQVNVYANEWLSGVDARIGEGPWQPLKLRSWGDWAAALDVPQGSEVRFRAVGLSGAVVGSGCVTWPDAAPCPAKDDGQWATYFGGVSTEQVLAAAPAPDGGVYVTGASRSRTFDGEGTRGWEFDAFVTRFSPTGELLWTRFLGGEANEWSRGVAVASDGDVFIGGSTHSSDFPTTAGVFQRDAAGERSGFIARIGADGTLIWSSLLGGAGQDSINAIALDAQDRPVVGGIARSCDFPTTPGAHKSAPGCDGSYYFDGFVAKLHADGSGLVWATLVGTPDGGAGVQALAMAQDDAPVVVGRAYDGAVPVTENALFPGTAGSSGFLLELAPDGGAISYGTYVDANSSAAKAVAMDNAGQAVVAGETVATDFPTTDGAHMRAHPSPTGCESGPNPGPTPCPAGFAMKLDVETGALAWSTLLGGSRDDHVQGVAVDADGRVHVSGNTDSSDFVQQGDWHGALFLATLSVDGRELLRAEGFGGDGYEDGGSVAAHADGTAYLTGHTSSEGMATPHAHLETNPGTTSGWLARLPALPGADPPPADEVTFDHRGGNEWWVEVDVGPMPDAVQAMRTDGTWRDLTLRDWGNWAGSFRIPEGSEVRFRAQLNGAWHESCWFSHPEGVARCEETPPPPPPPSSDYVFDHRGGNEWWVEVDVEPSAAAVQARAEGGAWRDLTLRDWGNWAGSVHIPAGQLVQFRAHGGDGAWQESCWHTHPEGIARCGDTPPPEEFRAAFTPRGGSEWWIQVKVEANQALAGVDTRINGGDWRPLTLRDWGDWAESYHAPDGSQVEFRATAKDGQVATSQAYTWPQ